MRAQTRVIGWLACVSLAIAACDDARPAAEQKPTVAAALPPDPDLADPLGQAVADAAHHGAPDWQKQDKLWRGQLGVRERQGFLAVLVYGHCYRFIGVGGPGVGDLELALFDPRGVEMQRDVTQDATAVLGVDSGICPSEPGAYRIELRMREGSGSFALGLFRDLQ